MKTKYFISLANIASVFILCFSIAFTISFYHCLSREYDYNLMIGRGFVGSDAVYFSIEKDPEIEDIPPISGSSGSDISQLQLPDSSDANSFLVASQLGVIRAVFYQGDTLLPPTISGRFFTAQESLQDSKLAVIGRSFTDSIWYDQTVPMITLEYGNFEVIGIVGLQQDTLIDELVFINAGSVDEYTWVSGLTYLDSSRISPAKLLEDWSVELSMTSIYSIHKIDMSETAVDVISGGIFFSALLQTIIYSFLILVFLCTLVFFIKSSRVRVSVLLLNGHSLLQIVKRLSVCVFAAGSLGILLSVIVGILLALIGFFQIPSSSVISSMLQTSLFSVVAMLLFPVTLFFSMRKMNLSESLR